MVPIAGALVCAVLVVVGSLGPTLPRRRGLGRPFETLDGLRVDGEVSLLGAVVAAVTLLVVLARPGAGIAGWIALGGSVCAAAVGVPDWFVLDTAAQGFVGQTRDASDEVSWGPVLVTAAGQVGIVFAILVLQRLE